MRVQTASVLGMGTPLSSLEEYLATGGGDALPLARQRGPHRVIEEIKASGLRGRGGAGFPTGRKWETVRGHACPAKYVVCNAAEGEPATFKDRRLLRLNPYQVLEGLTVAAYAVGAQRAFVAVKEQFEQEIQRLDSALEEMGGEGLLGDVAIEVVQGPDEYLFGEEKAMLVVIEGREPLPRIFPPYKVGLFAKSGSANPTVMNNVETLANVPPILRWGAAWFRSVGVDRSPGTMLFTLVGDVQTEGVYELPLGTPVRTLIEDIGGGPPSGREVKAVFPGASHGILSRDRLDTPLDFDALKEAGSGLGAGGFAVYDDSTCIVEATLAFVRFLHVESCAQCPPCKQHSNEIAEVLERFEGGDGSKEDIDRMLKRASSVTGGQMCALPSGTAAIVKSAVETFRDEFEEHVGKKCDRRRNLMVPKLTDYDDKAGRFRYDDDYRRKQPDWSFDPDGAAGSGRAGGSSPDGEESA